MRQPARDEGLDTQAKWRERERAESCLFGCGLCGSDSAELLSLTPLRHDWSLRSQFALAMWVLRKSCCHVQARAPPPGKPGRGSATTAPLSLHMSAHATLAGLHSPLNRRHSPPPPPTLCPEPPPLSPETPPLSIELPALSPEPPPLSPEPRSLSPELREFETIPLIWQSDARQAEMMIKRLPQARDNQGARLPDSPGPRFL